MSRLLRTVSAAQGFMYRRGLIRKMGKMQQVLLTTAGRKSGKLRTVQLGAVPEGDGWVVIGSAGGSDSDPKWWLNMVANPNVTVQVNDDVIKARMQEITNPADYDRVWNTVVATSKGYANYPKKTSRKIPLGWLRPA
jgi:deazaflavin-dependent oxidoreductase (nitroreductase family)